MRFYLYNPAGGFVSAEVAVPSGVPGDALAMAIGAEEDARPRTREQMLGSAETAEALRAWESGDDGRYAVLEAAADVLYDLSGAE